MWPGLSSNASQIGSAVSLNCHDAPDRRQNRRRQEEAMPASAKNTVSTVIPALRYRDGAAAIDWLCRAFGFERHLLVPGDLP
jgi:hypothetical protein